MTTQNLYEVNRVADFFYRKQRHFTPSDRRKAVVVLKAQGLSEVAIQQVLAGRRVSDQQLRAVR